MSNSLYHTLQVKAVTPINAVTSSHTQVKDVKVHQVNVTPEIAQAWLAAHIFDGQRKIRPSHVSHLADQMKSGDFLPYTTLEFVFSNGQKHLTDGQHRLAAVVRSGIAQPFIVVERVAQNDDDVGMIYGLTDINLRRTISDMTSAIHLDSETGLSRTQLNELGACTIFMSLGFHRPKTRHVHRRSLIDAIRENAEYAKSYYEIIAGCSSHVRHALGRSATLAVAVVTYKYAYEKYGERIDEFWKGAAFDDGLRTGDPRKHAYEHFLSATMPTGGTRKLRRGGQVVSADDSARFVATCYNKFIQGNYDVGRIVPAKKFKITGTPIELS